MAEIEGEDVLSETDSREFTFTITNDCYKDILIETSQHLMIKYVFERPNRTPPDPAVLMERLSLNDDESPVSRLGKKLLPLLQTRLHKLVCLLDPAHLLEDTHAKLKESVDHFQVIETTLDLIKLVVPQCWPEGEEVPESEDIESRRSRHSTQNVQLLVHLSSLFCKLYNFWENVRFSEDAMPDAEMEKAKVLEDFVKASDHIDVFINFLESSFFDVIRLDLQRYTRTINWTIRKRLKEWDPDNLEQLSEYENPVHDPMIAVLKLCRTLINKISRRTNNEIVIFRKMKPKEFEKLQKIVVLIPYWAESLGDRLHHHPRHQDHVVDALARLLNTIQTCFAILEPFLKSPPPGVDPTWAKATHKKFQVWWGLNFLALNDITEFIGCEFPDQDYCESIEIDPLRR